MPTADSGTEDTLDLKLSPEVLALFAATPLTPPSEPRTLTPPAGRTAPPRPTCSTTSPTGEPHRPQPDPSGSSRPGWTATWS